MSIIHTPIPISDVFKWAEDFEDSNFLEEWKRAIEDRDEDASPNERVLVFEITEGDFKYALEWGNKFVAMDGSDYTEDIEKALKHGRRVFSICDDRGHFVLGYVLEKRGYKTEEGVVTTPLPMRPKEGEQV